MKEIKKVELGFNADVRKAFAEFLSAKATIAEATAKKDAAQKILFEAVGENNQATFVYHARSLRSPRIFLFV